MQLDGNAVQVSSVLTLTTASAIAILGNSLGNPDAGPIYEFMISNEVPSGTAFAALYSQILANIAGPGQILNLSCFYDQDDTYSDTIPMNPGFSNPYPNGQVGSPPSVMRFDMRRTEISNLTLQFTEDASTYSFGGLPLQLNGLTLVGGVFQGPRLVGPGSNAYSG